jgi:hypothetical protein
VGQRALEANTTGAYNTAEGANSLYSNTTGSQNTALGYSALFTNTTASQNTAIGYQALYSNNTNSDNTAVGYQAGYSSTAYQNTYIGVYSGSGTTTGNSNTFVGYASGFNGSGTGSSNTCIGHASGSALTSGGKNTILGKYTGNQGGLDIRTASNRIVLSDGDGNPRGVFTDDGNFLVGAVATAGTVSNTKQITGGKFSSFRGVITSLSSGVAYTMFTLTADFSAFLVTVSGNASSTGYSETAIVHLNNTAVSVTIIADGGAIVISNSGFNVQVTQNSGGTMSEVYWSAMRIL